MYTINTLENIEFTASNGRMKYHPGVHENHRNRFTEEELSYMCSIWECTKKEDIAFVLGRTHGTVLTKVNMLKESGEFEYYKRLGMMFYHVTQ
ncbi:MULTISPECIES: DNA-entry nuclease [unclassified Psychrobacillus]|uniref:DNA-entry nuclease n=1 Tax=unclassified Psychrobacillus TaxID=2636677 RepID=UPI0030FCDA92